MTTFFRSVKHQKPDMTVGELGNYIRHYVDAQFPGNAIDYWGGIDGVKDKLVGHHSDHGFHHVAAYTRKGHSEAEMIHVCLMLNDGRTQEIGRAKSFDSTEDNWIVSRAISEVIESLYSFHELPLLVDFAAALPMTPRNIKDDGNHTIELLREDCSLTVIFDGHAEVAHYEAPNEDGNGRFYVDDLVIDWERLAKNCDMQVVSADDRPSLTQ